MPLVFKSNRPGEKISGFLEVGINENGEVVMNHPKMEVDENGCGYLVFSPNQARMLATILFNKAYEAENYKP